jgi:hypothetical protein
MGTCLFFHTAIAQQNSSGKKVNGTVFDEQGRGLPFVSVALLQQKKIITFALCDEEGRFSLPNVPKGDYQLRISSIGYFDTTYDVVIDGVTDELGSFQFKESITLGEAVVTARKQVVHSKVDRLVYDVSKDTSAARSNIVQLLDKIPFIQVDPITKKIKVMGEENFSITVNGKKSLLVSESNQFVQEVMKGGKLKEIELITSPDGQYSNQTAVINFVTTSSLPDGFAARINVNGNTNNALGSNIGITSKIGRLVFDISGGYNWSNRYGSESWAKRTSYTSEDYRFSENHTRNNPRASYGYNAELKASYDITPLDLLTFRAKIAPSNKHAHITSQTVYSNANNIITRELTGTAQNSGNNNQYEASLNYQRSFKEKPGRLLTATYLYDNRTNRLAYDMENSLDGHPDNHYATRNNTGNAEHTAAVDFYNPVKSNQSYYVTGKYIHRTYGSDSWQRDLFTSSQIETPLNAMDYIQQIGSVMANYSYRSTKWMVTAQAATEYLHNDITFRTDNTALTKGTFTWTTSLLLTYRPSITSNFMFAASRRTFRPDINLLNPYEDHSVPGQISKGNPDLNDMTNYHSSLIYRFFLNKKINIRLVTACMYMSNLAHPYTFVDKNGMFVSTYTNTGNSLWGSFAMVVEYNPFSRLWLLLSNGTSYNQFEYPENRNRFWRTDFGLNATLTMWKGGFLRGSLRYTGSDLDMIGNMQAQKLHYVWNGDLEFAQSVGKNLNFTLMARDPWRTYNINKTEDGAADFYNYREEKMVGRSVNISLTYTFGRFTEQVKISRREVRNTDRVR